MSDDGVRAALRQYAHRALDEAHPVDLRDGIGVELDRFAMHRAADLVADAFADANIGDLVRLALRERREAAS